MEEKQSSLLPEQQDNESVKVNSEVSTPEETVAEPEAEVAVEPEAEVVAEPEAEVETEDAESQNVVRTEVAHVTAEDVETETSEEEAKEPSVATKTAEEVKALSDEELLSYMRSLTMSSTARQVLRAVSDVKSEFKDRQAANKAKFESEKAEGENEGETQEKEYVPSSWEVSLSELIKSYDEALAKEREEVKKQQERNASAKQQLIEELKKLVEGVENPGSILRSVKDIVAKWKGIGAIPADKKDMNSVFHNITDEYFQKLKIDRELRELDMRRNLQEKTKLCEEAEALANEPSASKAFFQVQRLHANWKALGPVTREESDNIWNRFRAATAVINKRMHKQAEADHEKEKENYENKTKICEEAEALAAEPCTTAKEMDTLTAKIQELQKKWRTIGFAPKDVNDAIYARFRAVCDKVFEAKREFFKDQNSKLAENLKKKEELCEKAEAVMNSTDWKQTANYLIELQKQWKEIGAVTYKQSDAIWKRFRKACDTFFDNRQKNQEGSQTEMTENLAKKQAVIEELKAFEAPSDDKEYLKALQQIMQKWNAIGFVPMKDKQVVNKEYSELISKHFEALKLDKSDTEMQVYRGKVEAMASDRDRLSKERSRLLSQIRQAEQDVETLENNIGFFAKSKNSEGIVAEVRTKIEKTRADIQKMNKKLSIIDEVSR